jgi:hypothetical protein
MYGVERIKYMLKFKNTYLSYNYLTLKGYKKAKKIPGQCPGLLKNNFYSTMAYCLCFFFISDWVLFF